MLGTLMKYEWRNLSADRAPLAVFVILGVAIVYGAFNGSSWVRFQQGAIAEALGEERERLERIGKEIPKIERGEMKISAFADPRLPQSFGRNMGTRYAVMPPAALGSLAIGQSDLYPYYFRVSTNSKESFVNNDELENPVHLLAGRFDLAFVLLYLYPLVILAFTYNIVSAEKEAGTLGMTLSQPVSLARVVMAKVWVRATFVLALSVVLPVAGVLAGGADLTAEGALTRLLLWSGVTAAYGAFWFALAIAVNALGRGSAANAMVLAGAWLLLVVIVPAAVNVVVKVAYPVPSRIELIQSIRVAGEESTKQGSKLLAQYLEDHPELALPAAGGSQAPDFGTLLVAVNEATERKVQPVLSAFDRQLASQQRMVEGMRYLSPAIVAQTAFYDLAGTGRHRYNHFLAQVDEYHREWRGFLVPRILKKQKLTGEDLKQLPVFAFREEATADVAGRAATAFPGLLLPVLLAGLPAVLGLKRYPVAG